MHQHPEVFSEATTQGGARVDHCSCLRSSSTWRQPHHRTKWFLTLPMGSRRCTTSGRASIRIGSQESFWRTTEAQREGKDSFRTRACQIQAVSPQQCSWKVASIRQSWIPGDAVETEDQAGQDNRSLDWSCTSPTTRREHTMVGAWGNAHPGQDQPVSRVHATRRAPSNFAGSCNISPSRDDGQPSEELHRKALHQCHGGEPNI